MTGLTIRLRTPLAHFELDLELASVSRRLGLFGPSGAGKTTLLETVAGWRAVEQGFVELDGRVLLDTERGIALPVHERGIGYVPQDGLLFPHWSVRRNVEAGTERLGGPAGERSARVRRALEVLELGALLERSTATLSGGERQRVALARALCSGPTVLLLDEPLASLDLGLRRRILPYLVRVAEEFGIPMLYVSHDATEIAVLCDEVAFLHQGRVAARGSPQELFARIWREERLDEALENVLRGSVLALEGDVARVALDGGGELFVPAAGLERGARAVLGLRADEILVASVRPEGLSARNVLPATVARLDASPRAVVLHAALDPVGPSLDVLLTRASTASLGLRPGTPIFLVLKSNSVRVLSALRNP